MIIGFLWILLSIVIGVAANKYDRSCLGWIFISLLISPLVAGVILIVLSLPGKAAVPASIPTYEAMTKACPLCAETIKMEAIRCKHCGADLDDNKGSAEHVFTVGCYNCDHENTISRATIAGFPNCTNCGKMMFDPKRKPQIKKILEYVTDHRNEIDDVVYKKVTATIESF